MFDIAPLESFLQWKLSIETPSLAYAGRAETQTVLFALEMAYHLFKAWHSFLKKKPGQNTKHCASQEPSTSTVYQDEAETHYSYTAILELSIPGNCFCISEDQFVRDEIHSRLQKIVGAVANEYSKTKGGKRKSLNNKTRKFHIFEGQTASLSELKRELDLMKDELKEWKAKYTNLELELKILYGEMQRALKEKDDENENAQSINRNLLNYIQILEGNENVSYKGKDISEVQNKSRTLNTFLSRAQNAIWFSKSFGLQVQSMVVAETKTGALHTVEYHEYFSSF